MFDMMKQLHEMKKQAGEIKRNLDSENVECSDVRGIKIVISGSQDIRSIEIDDAYFESKDKVRFQNDLVRSFNAAVKKSQKIAAKKMQSVMPGFPGLK